MEKLVNIFMMSENITKISITFIIAQFSYKVINNYVTKRNKVNDPLGSMVIIQVTLFIMGSTIFFILDPNGKLINNFFWLIVGILLLYTCIFCLSACKDEIKYCIRELAEYIHQWTQTGQGMRKLREHLINSLGHIEIDSKAVFNINDNVHHLSKILVTSTGMLILCQNTGSYPINNLVAKIKEVNGLKVIGDNSWYQKVVLENGRFYLNFDVNIIDQTLTEVTIIFSTVELRDSYQVEIQVDITNKQFELVSSN